MKKIKVEEIEYELIKNYNEGYDQEEMMERWTEDFNEFDYVVGDYSYNKLRLKGFYSSKNKKVKDYNNYKNLEAYLKENCAYGCRYFVIKKIK
jgi:uncharacterized protein YutD